MLAKLEELEQKHNFNYPSLYKELCKDGMLDWGQTSPNWYAEQYPKLKENPPLLLYGNDIEMIAIENIEEHYQWLKDEDYPGINPNLQFAPFLQNGAGDLICFYLNEREGDDLPIAFVPHDSNEFTVKAKNLQNYIFRELLFAYVDVWDESLGMTDLKQNSLKMLASHSKYLTASQLVILEDVYQQELKEYSYTSGNYKGTAKGILTYDEFNKIIKQEIEFPLLNKEFPLYNE